MIGRRSLNLGLMLGFGGAMLPNSAASAEMRSVTEQRRASLSLATSYYALYNVANWLSLGKLFDGDSKLSSNSGFFVRDTPFVNGMASGHDETAGTIQGDDKIIAYLRKRRTTQKEGYTLFDVGEQFFSPEPSVVIAWMYKPGAGGPLHSPIYETHIFQCDIEMADNAVVGSRILSVHEVNLSSFEYCRA